jgi:hypothetical protein
MEPTPARDEPHAQPLRTLPGGAWTDLSRRSGRWLLQQPANEPVSFLDLVSLAVELRQEERREAEREVVV